MEHQRSFYEDNFTLILIVVLVLLILFPLRQSYLMDDAFISFRYSKHLAEGKGLEWNIGERVEGYSNYAWVLLMAAGMKLGIQPETFSSVMGMVFHTASLVFIYFLALYILKNRNWALIVLILFGMNWTASGFVTSGLETPLQSLLFVWTAWLFLKGIEHGWRIKHILLLSLALNIGLLNRPDTVVLVAAVVLGYYFSRDKIDYKHVAYFSAPFLLIILPYAIWKISYFGTVVPNSFNVKVHGASGIAYGLFYIYLFGINYLLLPSFLIVGWKAKDLWNNHRPTGFLAALCAIWMAYTVQVGGDFMDFRFMVAILPFLFIVIIDVLRRFVLDTKLRTALLVLLFLGTPHYYFTFTKVIWGYGVERIEELGAHVQTPGRSWSDIGGALRDLFGGTDVVLGIGPAGAIPYYTDLECVDIIGLTDPVIPSIAEEFSIVPGHRIIAPLDYLYKRNVNLVIQPVQLTMHNDAFRKWVRQASWADIYRYYLDVDKPGPNRTINEAILLPIPISPEYVLVVWYMNPHPVIEKVIRDKGLQRIRLVRS